MPVRDIVGYPSWVATERYDVTLKPPAGSTPEQRAPLVEPLFGEGREEIDGHEAEALSLAGIHEGRFRCEVNWDRHEDQPFARTRRRASILHVLHSDDEAG